MYSVRELVQIMKCKHYFYFGESIQNKMKSNVLECRNWELLREEGDENFSVERSIDEYRKNCQKADGYAETAKLIKRILMKHNFGGIASLGIGKGILEWHLKQQMPDLYMIGTDYTEQAIKLLRNVFVECNELKVFDMKKNSYKDLDADCLIMYRISTEFDFDEWCEIFDKIFKEGVRNIIYVPTELLNIKLLLFEKLRHIRNKMLGRKDTFCGYMYSETEFKKIFEGKSNKPLYRIEDRIAIRETAIYFLSHC